MRKIVAMLLTMTLSVPLCACNQGNKNARNGENENITAIQKNYYFVGGSKSFDSEGRVIQDYTFDIEFDEKNMPIAYSIGESKYEISYGSNGEVAYIKEINDYNVTTTIYNEFGDIISECGEYLDDDDGMLDDNGDREGDYDRQWIYTYDEAGHIIKEEKYRHGAWEYTLSREYNENGYIVAMQYEAGTSVSECFFEYDLESKTIKVYKIVNGAEKSLWKEIQYDDDGNAVYVCSYIEHNDNEVRMGAESTNEYDSEGRLVSYCWKMYNDDIDEIERDELVDIQYDDDGFPISSVMYEMNTETQEYRKRYTTEVEILKLSVNLTPAQIKVFTGCGILETVRNNNKVFNEQYNEAFITQYYKV